MFDGLIAELRRRRLVEWSLGYLAVAWVLLQAISLVAGTFDWPVAIARVATVVLAFGLAIALVVAWNHGERGDQRFGRGELLLIGAIALAAVLTAAWVGQRALAPTPSATASASAEVVVPEPRQRTVAVLPVAVLDADPTLDPLARQLEAELATELARAAIRLVPRSQLAPVAGQGLDATLQATGATHAIEASLRRKDGRLVVAWTFIGGAPPRELWTQSVTDDGTGEEPLAVEGFAFEVAGAVRFLLGPVDWMAPGYPTTASASAFEDLRRARLAARDSDNAAALVLIEQALASDPGFAQAHAKRGEVLAKQLIGGDDERRKAEARKAIERARALAPDLPEAALAEAWLAWAGDGDATRALAILEPMKARLPPSVEHNILRGYLLRAAGRFAESLDAFESLVELDRHHGWAYLESGVGQLQLRRYGAMERTYAAYEANWPGPLGARNQAFARFLVHGDGARLRRELAEARARYPRAADPQEVARWTSAEVQAALLAGDLEAALVGLAALRGTELARFNMPTQLDALPDPALLETATLTLLGRGQEAQPVLAARRQAFDDALAKRPDEPWPRLYSAWHHALSGRKDEARALLTPLIAELDGRLRERPQVRARLLASTALVSAWAGDADAAIALLARGLEEPYGTHAARVAREPFWRPLHADPRFVELLRARGFAP